MIIFSREILEIIWQLILAAFLGGFIGLERFLARRVAGMRTYALVSLGAALFSILSKTAFQEFWGLPSFDPSRIASQIVVGIGFIGAGVIIFHKSKLQGLTTAAGLWVAAAIGMSVGYKLYEIAFFTTLLVILILTGLWHIENKLRKKLSPGSLDEDSDF